MLFIVTLVALLIERFFDWSHLRHWSWFKNFQYKIIQRLPQQSPYLILALAIIPLLVVVGVLQILLSHLLYGFIKLVFEVFVLLYCLGPHNLWADAFACINALVQGDTHFAADKLKNSFGITNISYSQSLHRHLLDNIFVQGNRRVFAVVFWFLVFGAMGAVLYRAVSLSQPDASEQESLPEISASARLIASILDWLPVRLFTFIFALGGHFVQVLSIWRKKVLLGLNSNETLLTECGAAALGLEEQIPEDGTAERSAVSLLDRSFVIMLVLIAIGVLVF